MVAMDNMIGDSCHGEGGTIVGPQHAEHIFAKSCGEREERRERRERERERERERKRERVQLRK